MSQTPRAIREKRRYRSVLNATGDVKLARELRGRSESYIYENYGIKVASKIPKIKTLSKETKYKKQLESRKYQYAIARGFKPDKALELRKTSFKTIEERARYLTPREPQKTVKPSKPQISRKDRIKKWSNWSKKDNRDSFPSVIKNQAQQINIKKGFEINAKYGFTVMFYAYIEQESTKKWLDLIKADRVTEMAIYRTPTPVN